MRLTTGLADRLVGDRGPAEAPAIRRNTPVDEAFRQIIGACRIEIARQRAATLATGDPEAVHQTRVSLRRLRAALALFREAIDDPALSAIEAQAGGLAKDCGQARDVHVFLSETAPDAPQEVAQIGRKIADSGLRRARNSLSGKEFETFDRRLGQITKDRSIASRATVGDFGCRKLDECLRRVRRRGRGISTLSVTKLHRLRIATKKLRYASAFLAPVFDGSVVQYIEAVENLQDALGALNDRVVGKKILADIASAGSSGQAKKPCKRLKKRLGRNISRDKRRIRKAWKAFKKAEPFWRATRLVHRELAAARH